MSTAQILATLSLSDRATPEYKPPLFGADYGQPIFAWLNEH
jgi:hypothetical protein